MPRIPGIRRYIFKALTVVSLLMMLAAVGFGMHNDSNWETHLWHSGPTVNSPGTIVVIFFGYLTVEHGVANPNGTMTWTTYLRVPWWMVILLTSVLPATWLAARVWNKRRKLGPNVCPACGYDLTGNETGVCPECGVGIQTETSN